MHVCATRKGGGGLGNLLALCEIFLDVCHFRSDWHTQNTCPYVSLHMYWLACNKIHIFWLQKFNTIQCISQEKIQHNNASQSMLRKWRVSKRSKRIQKNVMFAILVNDAHSCAATDTHKTHVHTYQHKSTHMSWHVFWFIVVWINLSDCFTLECVLNKCVTLGVS